MSVQAAALQESGALFEQLNNRYAAYLAACRDYIARDLANCPAADHLTGYLERGKMIRPMLVFLSAAAAGGDPADALPAARSIELLHIAALIHDDIIDRAEERRGVPALHRRIGESTALVVGDHLILQSFEVLAHAIENRNAERVLRAVGLLSRYAQECCKGQIQELTPPSKLPPEQQYFSIVRGKTASQFAAAVVLGATFGNASDDDCRALRMFGINVGIAFQIRDDELDLVGDSRVLGKPVGNSIAAGRPLLPLIYVARHGSPQALAALTVMQNDLTRRRDLIRVMEEEGLLERVRRLERRFLSRALTSVERLAPSAERDALHALALYTVYRDS